MALCYATCSRLITQPSIKGGTRCPSTRSERWRSRSLGPHSQNIHSQPKSDASRFREASGVRRVCANPGTIPRLLTAFPLASRESFYEGRLSPHEIGMSFPNKGTITGGCRPYVPRLSHARLPNISVTKTAGCVLVQPGGFRHHPPFQAARPRNVCSSFALFVWISTFSSECASVVLLPLTIPPNESFPVHFLPHNLTMTVANCFYVSSAPVLLAYP